MKENEINDRIERIEEGLSDRTLMFFRQKDQVKRLEDDLASLKRKVDSNMDIAATFSARGIVKSHKIANRFKILFYLLIANLICNSVLFIHRFCFLGGR